MKLATSVLQFGIGVLLLTAAPACAGPATDFEMALWPGEGRPVLEAAAARLALRAEPRWTACPRYVHVQPGEPVAFRDTRLRTLRPGQVVALRRTTIEGRGFGDVAELSRDAYYRSGTAPAVFPLNAGDVVAYLQPRAEGTCLLRIGASVVEAASCPVRDPAQFRISTEPVVEWWVLVDLEAASGWTLVDGEHLKVVDRTF